VDHSTTGAKKVDEKFADYVGWLMAYAIAGHHGGLPDGRSGDRSSTASLEGRLEKKVPEYRHLPLEDGGKIALEQLPFNPRDVNPGYAFFFFLKMLFSYLVDADFLDTEAFMAPSTAKKRHRLPTIGSLRDSFEVRMSRFQAKAVQNSLNRQRREIYESCLYAAEGPVGLYSLTVPTGGGKTLSSPAFALRHAEVNDLERLTYVIAHTSISRPPAAETPLQTLETLARGGVTKEGSGPPFLPLSGEATGSSPSRPSSPPSPGSRRAAPGRRGRSPAG
jgi:CRISPR-associated endonuclease/helicase Cas3